MDGLVNPQALISSSDVDKVKSLVPDFEDSRMRDYLVLRSFNFTHEESRAALGVDDGLWYLWMLLPEFSHWVTRDLRRLQRQFAGELLRAEFLRNVFLVFHMDSDVLTKKAFDPESMTAAERDEAREAAKRYTAANLQAMLKAVGEETGDRVADAVIEYKIKVDVGTTEEEEADRRKIQARKLLRDFKSKQQPDNAGMVTIDENGEVVDG